MTIKLIYLSILFSVLIGCDSTRVDGNVEESHPYARVSIYHLVGNGESFDGKRVLVQGYADLQGSSSGLFVNEDAQHSYDIASSLDLLFDDDDIEKLQLESVMDNGFVGVIVVIGTYAHTPVSLISRKGVVVSHPVSGALYDIERLDIVKIKE